MTLDQIKSSVTEWAEKAQLSVEHEWQKGVQSFLDFVDGKAAAEAEEKAAIDLLTSRGYTVTKVDQQ